MNDFNGLTFHDGEWHLLPAQSLQAHGRAGTLGTRRQPRLAVLARPFGCLDETVEVTCAASTAGVPLDMPSGICAIRPQAPEFGKVEHLDEQQKVVISVSRSRPTWSATSDRRYLADEAGDDASFKEGVPGFWLDPISKCRIGAALGKTESRFVESRHRT